MSEDLDDLKEFLKDIGTVHKYGDKFYKKIPTSEAYPVRCEKCAFRDKLEGEPVCVAPIGFGGGYNFCGCKAGFKWIETIK